MGLGEVFMKKEAQASSPAKDAHPVMMPAQEQQATQHRPPPGLPVSETAYSVELHIEELVLRGFPASDRHRIGDAFERELTRLFTEQGAPPAIRQGGGLLRLDGGAFEVKPGSDANTIGAQLATAIYGGFIQ